MPTYQLAQGNPIHVPVTKLAVRIHALEGLKKGGIRVGLERDSSPIEDPELRRPAGGEVLAVIDDLQGPAVLRVDPCDGTGFQPGAKVDIVLAGEFSRTSDPYQVRLAAVDLSGLPFLEVARLNPGAGGLEILMLGDDRPQLDGTAKLAHDLTRKHLGRSSLPAGQAVDLYLIVDASASMRSRAASGLLGDVLDALGGIDHVIGKDGAVDVCLSHRGGWSQTPGDQLSSTIPQLVLQELDCGSMEAWPELSPAAAGILVTDLAPASWRPGPRDCCLVLCDPTAAEQLDGDRVIPIPIGGADELSEAGVADLVSAVLGAVLPAASEMGSSK